MNRRIVATAILTAGLAMPAVTFGADKATTAGADKSPAMTDRAPRDSSPTMATNRTANDASRYSDRERMRAWTTEKDQLEKAMKLGEGKAFYRQALEKMGYRITAVNYDKPDYLEYEVVKGDDSFEVQIDFDGGKSKKVDVTTNVWKTDATERALRDRNYRADYPAKTTANPTIYSDRDRMKNFGDEKDRLEKLLPVGHDRGFYRQALEKSGYRVTSVNYDRPDYVEYEIVKGKDSYEVQMDFDGNKAKSIDVTTNVWKAEATDKAITRR
jgi:HSP20 family molecular chaperone IbpA